MDFSKMLDVAKKFATDNSAGIMTGLGITGTVTTAVLAARAGYKSGYDVAMTENAREIDPQVSADEVLLEPKTILAMTWKNYIPAAASTVTTVGAVIMANQIGSRRAAAIAAAFKLSEELNGEYKQKIKEKFGAKKEEEVRAELTKERTERTPGAETIIIVGSEAVFLDELSGRWFKSDMESVRKAVNDINYKINQEIYASVSDLYELLGLDRTKFSDELGWNGDELLELEYTPVMMNDGRPAIGISFRSNPIRGFDQLN